MFGLDLALNRSPNLNQFYEALVTPHSR